MSPSAQAARSVLLTVTATGVALPLLPAAFRAIAPKVCDPFDSVVVSSGAEYGAAVMKGPQFAPSSVSCTPAMPTLSDAEAETVIVPETVAPAEGDVTCTDGRVAPVSWVTVTLSKV